MEIMKKSGEYAIIKRDTYFQPFVVTWLLEEYEEALTWGQGYYFDEYADALKFYNEKIEEAF